MNSHAGSPLAQAVSDPLLDAHDMMVAALDLIDATDVSGEVGATLNQSIELLRAYLPPLPPLKAIAF